jgi:Lon protease-like protein
MKSNKLLGMVQPKIIKNEDNHIPNLHKIGCMGKITSFKETGDGRYLIDLRGIIRFKVSKEVKLSNPYRKCEVNYETYLVDLNKQKEDLKFSDLELIFKDLRLLFEKRGFIINWKALEKQSLDETINALAMASPFSLEEKQILLETVSLDLRKNKIAEILSTYTFDEYHNTTLQ